MDPESTKPNPLLDPSPATDNRVFMQALELKSGTLRLVDRDVPQIPEGEARVRVQLAGLCSTDLQLKAGYMDFTGVLAWFPTHPAAPNVPSPGTALRAC